MISKKNVFYVGSRQQGTSLGFGTELMCANFSVFPQMLAYPFQMNTI